MSETYPRTERKTGQQMLAELDKSHWFSGIDRYEPMRSLSHLKTVMGMHEPGFKDTLYGNGSFTVPSELLTMYSLHPTFRALHEKRAGVLDIIQEGEYIESIPGPYEDDPIEITYPITTQEELGLLSRAECVEQQWDDLSGIVKEIFDPRSEVGRALTFGIGEVMRHSLAQDGGGIIIK